MDLLKKLGSARFTVPFIWWSWWLNIWVDDYLTWTFARLLFTTILIFSGLTEREKEPDTHISCWSLLQFANIFYGQSNSLTFYCSSLLTNKKKKYYYKMIRFSQAKWNWTKRGFNEMRNSKLWNNFNWKMFVIIGLCCMKKLKWKSDWRRGIGIDLQQYG